jgi:hypothetical protein
MHGHMFRVLDGDQISQSAGAAGMANRVHQDAG